MRELAFTQALTADHSFSLAVSSSSSAKRFHEVLHLCSLSRKENEEDRKGISECLRLGIKWSAICVLGMLCERREAKCSVIIVVYRKVKGDNASDAIAEKFNLSRQRIEPITSEAEIDS